MAKSCHANHTPLLLPASLVILPRTMTDRSKLFVPSPGKRKEGGDEGGTSQRVTTRSSAKLAQSTLSGYAIKKRRGNEIKGNEIKGSEVKRDELKDDDVKLGLVHPPLPSSRNLSPSPPPPRVPRDFVQVTRSEFLAPTKTPIPGVHYLEKFIPHSTAREWYESLVALPQWYRPMLKLYGREIVQSRQIIAFSKVPHLKLKYSGTDVEMHDWPDVLRHMERRCREVVGDEVRFNHAMLNYYPSGDTHIGRHADNRGYGDEVQAAADHSTITDTAVVFSVENKVILTVSLGSPRTWVMTKRPPPGAKAAAKRAGKPPPQTESHRWTIENGSLLLMQGDTQREWYHEIPKQAKIKQGRIVSIDGGIDDDGNDYDI